MPTSVNSGAPFDMQSGLEEVATQKALAQMLMQSALGGSGQGQMVSGHYVAPSPLAALLPLANIMASRSISDKAKTQQEALGAEYNQRLQEGMKNYFDLRDGKPSVPLQVPMAEGQPQPMSKAVPGDLRAAAIAAMTSGLAPLQKLGESDINSMNKGPIDAKDLLPYADPSSIPALMTKGLAGFQPKPDVRETEGSFYNVAGGKVAPLGGATFGPIVTVDGDKYQAGPGGKLRKLDNAPKVSVSMNPVINGSKAGMEEWAKLAGKQVNDMATQANAAVELRGKLAQLGQLSDSGVFNGPTSGAATWLGGLLQAAGMPSDVLKVGNSQAYNSVAQEAVQKLIGQYGGNRGITASEAEQIRQVVPQLSSSPQARKVLTQILDTAAQRSIANYKIASQRYSQALRAENPELFDMTDVMVPSTQGQATVPGLPSGQPAPMSLDDYLRSKGVR